MCCGDQHKLGHTSPAPRTFVPRRSAGRRDLAIKKRPKGSSPGMCATTLHMPYENSRYVGPPSDSQHILEI